MGTQTKRSFFILGNGVVLDSTADETEANTKVQKMRTTYPQHKIVRVHATNAEAACEQATRLTGIVFSSQPMKAAA